METQSAQQQDIGRSGVDIAIHYRRAFEQLLLDATNSSSHCDFVTR
jgi:hypothetical protein